MFYCPLPWCHYSIETEGEVHTCCNASKFEPLISLKSGSISDVENSPVLKKIKNEILNGEIPKQCQMCKTLEDNGDISLRQSSLERFGVLDKHSIKYLSLRFDNNCNLECITCSPRYSSLYGKSNGGFQRNRVFDTSSLDQLLKDYTSGLEELYVAGGEPFLSKDFYYFLNNLDSTKKREINLVVNTNLSVNYKILESYYPLLRDFKSVVFDVSIDEVEDQFEVLRKGASWDTLIENISLTRDSFPFINLKTLITVSTLNIKRLVEIIEFLTTNLGFQYSDIFFNKLFTPESLSIDNLTKKEAYEVIADISYFQSGLNIENNSHQLLYVQLSAYRKYLS